MDMETTSPNSNHKPAPTPAMIMNLQFDQTLLNTPISVLADAIRMRRITQIGEARYAKTLLNFDRLVEGRLSMVLALMCQTDDVTVFESAVLWLAGRDYIRETPVQMLEVLAEALQVEARNTVEDEAE